MKSRKAAATAAAFLSPDGIPLLLSCDGFDRCKAPAVAVVAELHAPGDLGKQRVVGADTHVGAGLDARAALPHNDRPAGHQLAAKGLHAQPLCIRVASVCGAAPTFFVCHFKSLSKTAFSFQL